MMLDKSELELKKLDRSGLETLVYWAKEEGWNPGPDDANAFYDADPDGHVGFFFQGEMIAGGSIVSYGGLFGFMGLFIVKPEYRSQGIGNMLWFARRDLLLERLKPGASIGMDGVVAMQPFYAKGGFKLAFRDERYKISGLAGLVDKNITAYTSSDLDDVTLYDTACFGVPRLHFLNAWLNMMGARTFLYRENGVLAGFVVMRQAASGYKIGPLFADNYGIAKSLLDCCLNAIPMQKAYLDIPVSNPEAQRLIQSVNGKYVFECARMYYGTPPQVHQSKIFGITSFELG